MSQRKFVQGNNIHLEEVKEPTLQDKMGWIEQEFNAKVRHRKYVANAAKTLMVYKYIKEDEALAIMGEVLHIEEPLQREHY